MKTTKIFYWILTVLFAGFMIATAVPEILRLPSGIDFVVKLGYPAYIVPLLGVGKLMGGIALLVPGFPRIKEWAYAGLFFDLAGATYSMIATSVPMSGLAFMLVFFALLFGSYILYHKKRKATEMAGVA